MDGGCGPPAGQPDRFSMSSLQPRVEAWPEFLRIWQELIESSAAPGTFVVVEGERDRAALKKLRIPGPIVLVHHGRTLSEVAHELARSARRVVVLTDWDTEGGHLAHRLREFLEALPLELDLDVRRRLARVLRGELVHVEGLAGWARRTSELTGRPIDVALEEIVDG